MDSKLVKAIKNAGWDNVEFVKEDGRYSADATYNAIYLELSVWFEGEEVMGTNHNNDEEADYENIPTPRQVWEDTTE